MSSFAVALQSAELGHGELLYFDAGLPACCKTKTFTLLGADGQPYFSPVPCLLGDHRCAKLYGRMDCRAALQALARGGYVKQRIFFADEAAAIAAGYRPCAVCMPRQYAAWKAAVPPNPHLPSDQ